MIRFRPLLIPTLWFVPALALLMGLGVWQVQRLHWKEALIARVESRMAQPAVPLDEALSHGLAKAEWRHVSVHGKFLNDDELYLFAPSKAGQPGYHVIAPLQLEGGNVVLIDRGFVPEDLKDPTARQKGQLEGEITVTGVLRLPQPPGLFTPAPDQIHRVWFTKDVQSMAQAAGVALSTPIVIEADATPNPGEYPLGCQTRVDFPNNHLQYAITWFALALVLTVIYLLYHRKQGRLG
jgi:surfeit locus 1 family protein